MKILELCHFSEGSCGVWARAKQESLELSKKGYNIKIFSSNAIKSSNRIAKKNENFHGIEILRFPFKKLGGESFMSWSFEKEAIEYSPDIIIAHNYRQLHTTRALKVAKELRKQGKKVKVFLVTHAPFVEGNITRRWYETLIVNLYDLTIGRFTLNKFDKILTISKWEMPYLIDIGARKDKMVYIPNGIPEQFFKQKSKKEEHRILFFSRISVKKKVETLIESIPFIKDKKIIIELVGPREEPYFSYINKLIDKLDVRDRVQIKEPIYDLKKKIEKIDSCKLFVLPSRVEGMPQALIEAMARKKIVIGSDSIAIRDLIKDEENGYLFKFDNSKSLAERINYVLSLKNKESERIKNNAGKSVEQFAWGKIIGKIDTLIRRT